VKVGDTLSQIAANYGISNRGPGRGERYHQPDLVYIGMNLLIPNSTDWVSPTLYGPASKFVASISQQRCWVYQGGRVVADWACSTAVPDLTRPLAAIPWRASWIGAGALPGTSGCLLAGHILRRLH